MEKNNIEINNIIKSITKENITKTRKKLTIIVSKDNGKLRTYYHVMKYILKHETIPDIELVDLIVIFIKIYLIQKDGSNNRYLVLLISNLLVLLQNTSGIELIDYLLPSNFDDINYEIPEYTVLSDEIEELYAHITKVRKELITSVLDKKDKIQKLHASIIKSINRNMKLSVELNRSKKDITKSSNYLNSSKTSSRYSVSKRNKKSLVFDSDGYIAFNEFFAENTSVDGPSMEKRKHMMLYDNKKCRDNHHRLDIIKQVIKLKYVKSKFFKITYNSSQKSPWEVLLEYDKKLLQKNKLVIIDTNTQNNGEDYGGLYKDFMTKVVNHIETHYLILQEHSSNYVINPKIKDKHTLETIGFVLSRMLIDDISFTIPISWSFIYMLLHDEFHKEDMFVLYFLDAKQDMLENLMRTCNDNDNEMSISSESEGGRGSIGGKYRMKDGGGDKRKRENKSSNSDNKKKQKISIANKYCNVNSIYKQYIQFASLKTLSIIKSGCYIPSSFLRYKKQSIGRTTCRDIRNILCSGIDIHSDIQYVIKNKKLEINFEIQDEETGADDDDDINYYKIYLVNALIYLLELDRDEFDDIFSDDTINNDITVNNNEKYEDVLKENMIKFRDEFGDNKYEEFFKRLIYFWTGSYTINKKEMLTLDFHYRFPNNMDNIDGFGTIVAHTCTNTLEIPIQTLLTDISGDLRHVVQDGNSEESISARFVALFLYCYTTGFQIS
jgi:hypothetical protein